MSALYLIRHSLTLANARHLYGGSTDSPLTGEGRMIARDYRAQWPLPGAELYVSSGMARADETLRLLTGRGADLVLPGLREMDFGAFELRGYEELRHDPAYRRWIEDKSGEVRCPGGECTNAFRARVLEAGDVLLHRPESVIVAVCHGGVIVQLMQAWFPGEDRHFYQWQPGPCCGYRIEIGEGAPIGYADFPEKGIAPE